MDSPGDIGNVDQTNGVYAGAAATGTTSGTTGAGGAGTNGGASIGSTGNGGTSTTSGGSTAGDSPVGDAHAKATQSGASNVNVSVRINSPGNNGAVNQSNTVGAEAGQDISGGTTGQCRSRSLERSVRHGSGTHHLGLGRRSEQRRPRPGD